MPCLPSSRLTSTVYGKTSPVGAKIVKICMESQKDQCSSNVSRGGSCISGGKLGKFLVPCQAS